MVNSKSLFTRLTLGLVLTLVAATQLEATYDLLEVHFEVLGERARVAVRIDEVRGATTLELQDNQKQVLISEIVEKGAYQRVFDLGHLPDGTYYFTAQDGLKVVQQQVAVQGGFIRLQDRESYLLPIIHKRKDSINVTVYSGRLTDVVVKLYDDSGRLVFEEKKDNIVRFQRSYDLSRLQRGLYSLMVTTPKSSVTKDFQNW